MNLTNPSKPQQISEIIKNKAQYHTKFSSQTHTHKSPNINVKVTYEKHQLTPLSLFVWFKKVLINGKNKRIYFKTNPKNSWKILQKGCPKGNFKELDRNKECSEGWEIGKMIARTITYLAIMQGRELRETILREESARNNTLEIKREMENLGEKSRVNMDGVSDTIINAITKTSICIKNGLSHFSDKNSIKKKCILKAMKLESDTLIEEILEGAVLHGFKCDYEALKKGKCRKMKEIISQIDQGKMLIEKIKGY